MSLFLFYYTNPVVGTQADYESILWGIFFTNCTPKKLIISYSYELFVTIVRNLNGMDLHGGSPPSTLCSIHNNIFFVAIIFTWLPISHSAKCMWLPVVTHVDVRVSTLRHSGELVLFIFYGCGYFHHNTVYKYLLQGMGWMMLRVDVMEEEVGSYECSRGVSDLNLLLLLLCGL